MSNQFLLYAYRQQSFILSESEVSAYISLKECELTSDSLSTKHRDYDYISYMLILKVE